jgi:hypothetical protein
VLAQNNARSKAGVGTWAELETNVVEHGNRSSVSRRANRVPENSPSALVSCDATQVESAPNWVAELGGQRDADSS